MHELQLPRCLNFLSEILHLLATTSQHERVFHLVVDRIVRLYGCQSCAIVVIDRKTEYLNIENSFGLSWSFCNDFRRQVATGAIGKLIWTGTPVLVHNSAHDPGLAQELMHEHPFASCLCVPLTMEQRSVGYLYMDSRDLGAFDAKDLVVAQAFADVAAAALQKSLLSEENLRLDRVDHETELEKFVPFKERLDVAMEMARSADAPLAVLILDVDNYKYIANTYGSATASLFLKELGGIVRGKLRTIDGAGRFGPDEIVIMLPRTGTEGALAVARGMREEVSNTAFTARGVRTTVSIGVAAFPENGRLSDDLLQSAKNALFEAQRAGRDKVFHYVSAWGDPSSQLRELMTT